MQPSVSRAVHVQNIHGECLAATVTRVHPNGNVDLFVMPPAASPYNVLDLPERGSAAARQRMTGELFGWHEPERVGRYDAATDPANQPTRTEGEAHDAYLDPGHPRD